MAIQEYIRRGNTSVIRWYYGRKDVVEWLSEGEFFNWFWEYWREAKEEVKSFGYGVFCDNGGGYKTFIYIYILRLKVNDYIKPMIIYEDHPEFKELKKQFNDLTNTYTQLERMNKQHLKLIDQLSLHLKLREELKVKY